MNPLAVYWPLLRLALYGLVLGATFIGGCRYGGKEAREAEAAAQVKAAKAEAKAADAYATAVNAVRENEQTRVEAVNRVAAAYERGKLDAQAQGVAVADGLRAGSLRFKRLWQGCQAAAAGGLSGPAADPGGPDDQDRLRQESAGRIIGAVAACQAERDALLKLAEADRQGGAE